jgi:glycerol-3-phosphate dehydrogenase
VTKDLVLVAESRIDETYALAVPSRESDERALVSRGRRHYFFIPWRQRTLIGSSHVPYTGAPDEFAITEPDIERLIEEVNAAYPVQLERRAVATLNAGMVPAGQHYGDRSRIVDHAEVDGVPGLLSIVGVRWTTSRGVAARAVDLVGRRLGLGLAPSRTADVPLHGARIGHSGEFLARAIDERPPAVSAESMRGLLHNHGSEYRSVLKYLDADPSAAATLGRSSVLRAEVVHAVREEMACTLGDVVLRRTDLGTAGRPDAAALQDCAGLMAAELGWERERVQRELDQLGRAYP